MKPLSVIILRGDDPTGHGEYGAKRGRRKHKGVDLVALPGDKVLAPFSGRISKLGYPYKNNTKLRLIEIKGDKYKCYLMYATLNDDYQVGDHVLKSEVIGVVQNIAGYHKNGMKNHLHFQLWKNGLLTDPEPLLNF